MENPIRFRAITPIYRFEFKPNDAAVFSCSGKFRDAEYSIRLKRYEHGKPGFEELMEETNQEYTDKYGPRHVGQNPFTGYFLVLDVIQPLDGQRVMTVSANTQELDEISYAILRSICLHSSRGLWYHKTHIIKYNPHLIDGSICSPLAKQYTFSRLGPYPSILSDSEFADVQSTFEALLEKKWITNATFSKILDLALEFHKTVFSLQNVAHCFLMLMIVFEAMFKKDNTEESSKAASRISKLISMTKNEKNRIHKEFFDNHPNTFCNIRNDIVHGDPNLDENIIRSKNPILYEYITKAIIKIITIPAGQIDYTKDYYDEISRLAEDNFNALPNI
jgi:hypothetical protein